MDRNTIRDAATDVANANQLSAEHRSTFHRLTAEVFQKLQPAISADVDERVAAGLETERTRIVAILDAPEAKGREVTARSLAFGSDISAEKAIEILKTTPQAKSPGRTPLSAAMAGVDNAVSDDDGMGYGGGADAEADELASRILNAE